MPLHPGRYAAMLHDKLTEHRSKVWLINTGWTGGSYGEGSRIKLAYTRAMVNAALTPRGFCFTSRHAPLAPRGIVAEACGSRTHLRLV